MSLQNRLSKSLLSCALFGLALASPFHAQGVEKIVDGFQQNSNGRFPDNWKTYPFHKRKAKKVYRIEQEGSTKFLRAVDEKDISVTIFHGFKWDVNRYPYLKFRWRAQHLPKVEPNGNYPVNDHACGVYVGFGRSSALKYVWSSELRRGSYWAKKPGKFVIVSAEYGPKAVGQWQSVTVDVPTDHQRYLGKPISKKPSGIAILTDGNNSHQKAACDYGDFRISDKP